MNQTVVSAIQHIFTVRWNPGKDLLAVAVSWVLVTGALYTATVIIGPSVWGGFAYFLLYALLCATIFGVGFPLYWTVVKRQRSIEDLGLTTQRLIPSLALQAVFSVLLYSVTLARVQLPSPNELIPLVGLALAIGFFEAIFWRGWVLLRLEDAFGIIPAILLGSALYAVYHIGYAMPASEITFLFFIGILFSVVSRLTKNIFILWPIFQPMGQLVTLIEDGLSLPLLAALGFAEVLLVMLALIWFAQRTYNKQSSRKNQTTQATEPGVL